MPAMLLSTPQEAQLVEIGAVLVVSFPKDHSAMFRSRYTHPSTTQAQRGGYANSARRRFASTKSRVSKPSVN